jgi:ribose 5-phosphate isomerase B
MKIVLASDHAGFGYKEHLKKELSGRGHEVVDAGAHSTEPVDYPDFVGAAARLVQSGEAEAGVVFGGSGNGEAMAANRFHRVRCALAWNRDSARLGKQHNNANVLSIGQRMVAQEELVPIVDAWLEAAFEGGRHVQRLEKLELLGP